MQIVVTLNEQPPHRVRAETVHPPGQRSVGFAEIERAAHHIVVAPYIIDCHHLRMKIAEPYEAVALHAIPQIILHIELYGICTCFPDFI